MLNGFIQYINGLRRQPPPICTACNWPRNLGDKQSARYFDSEESAQFLHHLHLPAFSIPSSPPPHCQWQILPAAAPLHPGRGHCGRCGCFRRKTRAGPRSRRLGRNPGTCGGIVSPYGLPGPLFFPLLLQSPAAGAGGEEGTPLSVPHVGSGN